MDTPPKHAAPRKPRSPGKAVVRWGLVVLMGLGGALVIDMARQSLATDRVQWSALDTVDEWTGSISPVSAAAEGASAAIKTPRPRLVRFTADWCPPCLSMKAQVFSKSSVADAIHERFDAYSVDLTQPNAGQEALGQHYRILYLPTLLITDGQGREIARLDEPIDAAAFTDWLERGYDRWAESRAEAEGSTEVAGRAATPLSPVSRNEPIN